MCEAILISHQSNGFSFHENITYDFTGNSLLTDTSLKRTPLQSEHVELVPAVLQSFTSSHSKADTSLRRIVGAGPKHVRLRGS